MSTPEPPRAARLRRAVLALIGLVLVIVFAIVMWAVRNDDEERPAGARPAPALAGEGGQTGAAAVYDRLSPSVVAVLVERERGGGEGSGVVWSGDTIVTNNHVVEDAVAVSVALASGERREARVVATDPLSDLAILRVRGRPLPPARFATELPEIGGRAIALGNPLGFENTITAGIVSGLDRSIPSGGRTPALIGLIQTDAPISPGNSGGALADRNGHVIGVNVAYIPPQARAESIGFAIPAPTVAHVVRELQEDGEVDHAYAGTALAPLEPEIARRFDVDVQGGAVVMSVAPGGPADRAGLRPGDVLVRAGGEPVRSVEDVFAAVRARAPRDRLEVEYLRDGQRREAVIALARRPSS